MNRIIDDIDTARGFALRISLSDWRGKARVDVRHFYEVRPGDPDTRMPTKKGASVPLDLLPRLLAALHELEEHAIRAGDLLAEDYENAGLPLPPALDTAGSS